MLLYLLAFLVYGIVWGYNSKMQSVTLNMGKYIARGNVYAGKTGFQDAITPKFQDRLNGFIFVMLFLFIAGFFVFKVYIPFIALFLFLISSLIAKAFSPNKLFPYVGKIIGSLSRRSADYRKKGDLERYKAAKNAIQTVSDATDEIYAIYGKDATISDLVELVQKT